MKKTNHLYAATANAEPRKMADGGVMYPFNVASGLVACTLNTRYDMMAVKDIFSLRHFPKTVVLIQHEE